MVARLHQRRLVAVFGDIEALQGRLWLEALRQGIRSAPQVVWLSDGARGLWCLFEECFTAYAMGILDFYHAAQQLWKEQPPGWMDARAMRVGGSAGHGTAYGMASRMGSWQTWQMPWTWRGCLRQHETRCAPCMPTCNGIREHIDYARYKNWGCRWAAGW